MTAADPSDRRLPVAVLGATGSVGQRFVSLLAEHPWFRIAELTASERSAGKSYAEAADWFQETPIPGDVAAMTVLPTDPQGSPLKSPILFSALDARAADRVELPYARAGHVVVSNARSHRMDGDVPLMVPEVNPEHLRLLDHQDMAGRLVTNPNCSTLGLTLSLKPLWDAFGIEAVSVVTLQALSGAGIPGVASLHILDNVVPYIGGEEDKLENETQKILGQFGDGAIEAGRFVVSATCTRVPVIDGHTLCVSVRLDTMADLEEVRAALEGFTAEPQRLRLPSAPERPVELVDEPDRPQPRLDRGRGRGMASTVGRLRPCPLLDYKYVTLSHNTLRGAAGGSILVAELALAKGRRPGLAVPE
ncbi:MAG: aspartate-semialdehyde dehydrogenase [Acidobacteriota bacterium]